MSERYSTTELVAKMSLRAERLQGMPLQMDRSIPFVSAVFRYVEGTAPIDPAISILKEAESRHGLLLDQIGAVSRKETGASKQWCEAVLCPFLSTTHLVLAGSELLTICDICDSNHREVSLTWREWGALLAEWANQFWLPRPFGIGNTDWQREPRPWEYMDFYMQDYIEPVVANYAKWAVAVAEILQRKWALKSD